MKLRYVEIEPSRIYNRLAIENLTCWQAVPQWHNTWFEPEVVELRNQFAETWRDEYDKVLPHFNKIEQSLPIDGMISPVSVYSGPPRDSYLANPKYEARGHYPPHYVQDFDNMLTTYPFGGSRITIAEKLGITKIPCLVHDFSNLFPNAPEVTRVNFRDWFDSKYIFFGQAPHIRDGAMNSNNRTAQNHATKIAKEKMNV